MVDAIKNTQVVQSTKDTVKESLLGKVNYTDDTQIRRSTIIRLSLASLLIIGIVVVAKFKDVIFGTSTNVVPYLMPISVHGCVTKAWIKTEMRALLTNLKKELDETHYNPLVADARCDLFKKVNELSDNQIIAFGNTYKKRFSKSLVQHISEQNTNGCGVNPLTDNEGELLVKKLTKLNLA